MLQREEGVMRLATRISAIGAAVLILAGCASMMGLPQGSVMAGEYQGRFDGKFFWGTIEVRVYEAPGGGRPVIGNLQQDARQGGLVFRGEVRGSRMEAQFGFVYGSVTGELSPDGRTMSGTYTFTDPPFDQGTWTASKW
jgi:hypothetical protein